MTLPPSAERAFQYLDDSALLTKNLCHPSDRMKAWLLFREFVDRGILLELAEVKGWFIEHGWEKEDAFALANMPDDIKCIRSGRAAYNSEAVREWFAE